MDMSRSTTALCRDMLWPVLLILLLGICFALTTRELWQLSIEDCYANIEQSASRAATTLKHNLDLHKGHLELVAGLMADDASDSPEELKERLKLYCAHQHADALCIQFPDGTLIWDGSDLPDYASLPSFSAMQDAVPCISGRFPGVEGSGEWFLYQAVPILNNGQTVAILYGLLNLKKLPSLFKGSVPYGGASQLYLIDGDTGNFLMEMWRNTLGNLFDGRMTARQAKPGYDLNTMLDDLAHGRPGYFVFVSRTTGESFYTRYQPVGLNNWSIQLTVLESVAFAETKALNRIILILGSVVTAITALYILAVFSHHRRRLRLKQRQIQLTTFMFEIQQILFEAYQNPEQLVSALKLVAETLEAEGVLLLSLRSNQIRRISAWREEGAVFDSVMEGNNLEKDFPVACRQLMQNKSILFYETDKTPSFSPEELTLLQARKVHSAMLAPVLDTEGVLHGALCAVNLRKRWKNCSYLECVSRSFMMAMGNMESYQIIRDMGTIDLLTGMKNRNSYEVALPRYAAMACDRLYCVYTDVNGLHELNNQYGHKAGDAMLRFTADCICTIFGREHAYRIGGDEFVVFVMDGTPQEVAARIARLRRQMEEKEYYISVGTACRQAPEHGIDQLITQAEKAMYKDKRAFYQTFDWRGRQR